jgi:MYXO-CTERM domain-containing protein
VPISHAQAAMGVDWDVTTVPPGVYTIWGYTWDPLVNIWAPRPGFVKLIASASEADSVGPAIALVEDDVEVTVGEPHAVVGCADVPSGSTVTLEWGRVEGPLEPQWHAVVVDEPISTGALTLELTLPAEALRDEPGQSLVRLRATVTDTSGRRHVAHSPRTYQVLPGEEIDDGDGGCRVGGATPKGGAGLLVLVLSCTLRRRHALHGVTPSAGRCAARRRPACAP